MEGHVQAWTIYLSKDFEVEDYHGDDAKDVDGYNYHDDDDDDTDDDCNSYKVSNTCMALCAVIATLFKTILLSVADR